MSRREAMLAKKYGASWKEENPTMVHRKQPALSSGAGGATSTNDKSAAGASAKSDGPAKQFIMHKLIRAPRTSNKTFNLMKFREGSDVNVTSLVEPVTLTRDEAEGEEQLQVSYPTQGEGSEYGRAERDALRRMRYRPRKEKEKDVHYHLRDKDGVYMLGELQREARGKYFLLEALEGGLYQIRPVDNFWEFRKHRVLKNRTTIEDAELAIKQRSKTVDVSRFFEKSLRGNQDNKRLRAEAEKTLTVDRGEEDDTRDNFDDGAGKDTGKKKKRVTKIATQKKITEDHNVEEEEVENVDDDFYAPDSDTELGGTKGRDWYANAENQESGSSSEEDEDEDTHVDALAGEGAVKRQRDSEDEVEDEDDDEEEEEENGDNDSDPDVPAAGSASTQTATSAKPTVSAPPVKPVLPTPAGASAAAAAAATTSAAATVGGLSTGGPAAGGLRVVRPRDSDTDDQAPDAKRQRAGDAPTSNAPATMANPVVAGVAAAKASSSPARANPARRYALDKATRDEIRADIAKYMKQKGLNGITLVQLYKKLKKKDYMKTHKEQSMEFLTVVMPEISTRKKIEGEDRYILKAL